MSTEAKWRVRVKAWRESGQTAEEFAEDKPFRPSTLRYWASQVKARDRGAEAAADAAWTPEVRVVKVQRPLSGEALVGGTAAEAAVVVEVGTVRVAVRRGFDAALLREVLEVVAVLGGRR